MPYLNPSFALYHSLSYFHLHSHLQSSPWSQSISERRNTEYEGMRGGQRRRENRWLPGTFAVSITGTHTCWRQATVFQSNLAKLVLPDFSAHVSICSAFPFCSAVYKYYNYLAWELSSGAVTKCLLLSLLKTRAFPLASTPQPKLTSAPRSEEKVW